MGMELDPDGYGSEGVACQPVEVDPVGLSDPLPHPHLQPERGGRLEHVKNLWTCLDERVCGEVAGDDPAGALAGGVQTPVFHQQGSIAEFALRVPEVLQ